jgi:hypothetical protein
VQIWRVGTDRVQTRGDGLIVHAAHEMPDWKHTQHRPALVEVADRRFQVMAARSAADGRWTYELAPYVDVLNEIPACVVEYDEDYVAGRDRCYEVLRSRRRAALRLRLFYPLLGFGWARRKQRWHELYGLELRALQHLSLCIEFATLLSGGVLFMLSLSGMMGDAIVPVLLTVALASGPDFLVRYGAFTDDSAPLYGFYEWLLPRGRRPAVEAPEERLPAAAAEGVGQRADTDASP